MLNMEHSLKLIYKYNLKIVDFLDVTLNLTGSTYKSSHKLNDEICYIQKQSNHPSSIKKQLPISIKQDFLKYVRTKKCLINQIQYTTKSLTNLILTVN